MHLKMSLNSNSTHPKWNELTQTQLLNELTHQLTCLIPARSNRTLYKYTVTRKWYHQFIITSITVIIINGIMDKSGYYYWVKVNTTVHMFHISNMTGISFKQKFLKVGVWQPVPIFKKPACFNIICAEWVEFEIIEL